MRNYSVLSLRRHFFSAEKRTFHLCPNSEFVMKLYNLSSFSHPFFHHCIQGYLFHMKMLYQPLSTNRLRFVSSNYVCRFQVIYSPFEIATNSRYHSHRDFSPLFLPSNTFEWLSFTRFWYSIHLFHTHSAYSEGKFHRNYWYRSCNFTGIKFELCIRKLIMSSIS